MGNHFKLSEFIAEHVTGRSESLFEKDIQANFDLLSEKINGRSALVIGGAGSIGSSYIKSLLRFRPKRLYVIDINENGLTELTRDIRSSANLNVPTEYKTYPINFGDEVFKKIYRQNGPFEIVANFAAHKHVRSEKDQYSIEAMLENNVLKAKSLLDLLTENPPAHFFCVSTDKAANPVNVMGASKKLMEEVIMAFSRKLNISTARFANVAFSNGSLLAGFLERLNKRQPFSAPLDVRRYFVSPEESGQICLLACMLGDSGDIFFPKLNEVNMKRFSTIGSALLKVRGYEPYLCASETEARAMAQSPNGKSQYPVWYFPSDTSGEKQFEEFYTDEEELDMESFAALGVVKNSSAKKMEEIERFISALKRLFSKNHVVKQEIVSLLSDFIPNFEHLETGKNLDSKM